MKEPTMHTRFEGELTYVHYRERQAFEVSPEGIAARIDSIAPAGQNVLSSNLFWSPVPYIGFAFVAMANERNNAVKLTNELHDIQRILLSKLDRTDTYCPLPPESFHQTIANTFSDDRYERHLKYPGLVEKFPHMTIAALDSYPIEHRKGTIHLRLLGLSLFRTAIGVLADFESEEEYDYILSIREYLYGNCELRTIGLRKTRPFIGHITLAYIEKSLDEHGKTNLVSSLNEVNKYFVDRRLVFNITKAELCRYDHLSAFHSIESIPSFTL